MNETSPEKVVLIVDDEADVRRAVERALRRQPWRVVSASSAEEALGILAAHTPTPQVVLSDFMMPEVDGVTFLGEVRKRWPRIQRVLLTGYADVAALERAINEVEVFRFLAKPWDNVVLVTTIRSAFEEYTLRAENERLLMLTQEQNQTLAVLNKGLEARVEERTRLLERAKKDWEATFDSIVDPVAIIDTNYQIRRSNLAYGQHTDVEVRDLPGRTCYSTLIGSEHVCKGCPLQQTLDTHQAAHGEVTEVRRGQIFQVWTFPILESESEVGNIVCYYRNVTEEKELQQRLLQTEKMAAVGQLAGGVAHEINNPLAGILAFTQLLMRETPPQGDAYSFLKEIENSALRCKRIVENLLRFSRRSPIADREAVQLNEVIDNTLFLVEHQFQLKNVTIERDLGEDVPVVRANSNQIGQVLLNLLTNAFGAMPRGGRIVVRTWGDSKAALVGLSVSDDGLGIPPRYLSKIFEPFFTTKADGTGLGLAVSADIVQAHGGKILVESEEGRGSTFTVMLPALREAAGVEARVL
jgi:two-component system NtrC family sensor kinase